MIDGFTITNGNTDDYGGGIKCQPHCSPTVRNCTFAYNSTNFVGGGMCCDESCYPLIENTIIASSHSGEAIGCLSGGVPTLTCCDIYGNAGGDYVGCITDQLGVDGNFSARPSFCLADVEPYDLHLCDESPCLPGNHPDGYDCGLIGALGEGCSCGPTQTEPVTWGAIKAMYR